MFLFITSENFFSVYLKDLNVPIAYIILTISILFICYKKNIPKLRSFFILVFTVPSVASILDAVYDYQIKIFVYQNMSLGEGILFLLFPVPFYALTVFIWKYGKIERLYFLIYPIIYEISCTFLNLNVDILRNENFTPLIRYFYVLVFIYIILGLNKNEKVGKTYKENLAHLDLKV